MAGLPFSFVDASAKSSVKVLSSKGWRAQRMFGLGSPLVFSELSQFLSFAGYCFMALRARKRSNWRSWVPPMAMELGRVVLEVFTRIELV